jgi:tetratricopeptide (TPR) repeat protein
VLDYIYAMKFRSATTLPRPFRPLAASALLIALALSSACEPSDPLAEIRQQQTAGQFAPTVEPLRELLKDQPENPEANYLYGRALSMTKGSNLAIWSLRKAMRDPEWKILAARQLAFMALAAGDFNEVIRITDQILEDEPENVKALLMRANAYAHWKKAPDLALADAKRVLEIDPDAVEAYEPLILGLLDTEQYEEASKMLAEAGERVLELGTTKSVLAWHCATTSVFEQELGEVDKARENWGACLEAYPNNIDVVTSAIKFFDSQGESARSLGILRAALESAPASRNFRVSLAQRLVASGDRAGAESVLLDATQSDMPEVAAAGWIDLAKMRLGLEEYQASSDAWDRALEFAREAGDPSPQLLFEHADALVLAGRFERALEAAENLPVPVHGHLIRARVAQERAQPAVALEEFDEALRLWPDNPWARYYAALAAEELGDFGRALEEYRYSVRIEAEATDARSRGAALLFAEGKPSFALQMLHMGGSGAAPPELEGQLLFLYFQGLRNDSTAIQDQLARLEQSYPASVGKGLAAAAEGLALRTNPAVAVGMLASAPGVNYSEPRFAPALRLLIEFSHQANEATNSSEALQKILEVRPDSAVFQEIYARDLELSGASPELVRAAYSDALALDPANALALASLGRLTAPSDPLAALGFYDRAVAADPSLHETAVNAAKLLAQLGESAEAAARLDALLREHPFEAEAAMERVVLDLTDHSVTDSTLERARRAARFGGGAKAFGLLSQVHAARGDAELAAQASERALVIQAAEAAREQAKEDSSND